MARNQLARTIDVALGEPAGSRDFNVILVTPACFKNEGVAAWSRLYAYKMHEYRTDFRNLMRDLPHRTKDKEALRLAAEGLGWVSWEELASMAARAQEDDTFWEASSWDLFQKFLAHRGLR